MGKGLRFFSDFSLVGFPNFQQLLPLSQPSGDVVLNGFGKEQLLLAHQTCEMIDACQRRIHGVEVSSVMKKFSPRLALEPTAVGAVSLRSQRRHNLVARQETFASRIVVAIAVHATHRQWLDYPRQAASCVS